MKYKKIKPEKLLGPFWADLQESLSVYPKSRKNSHNFPFPLIPSIILQLFFSYQMKDLSLYYLMNFKILQKKIFFLGCMGSTLTSYPPFPLPPLACLSWRILMTLPINLWNLKNVMKQKRCTRVILLGAEKNFNQKESKLKVWHSYRKNSLNHTSYHIFGLF